MSQTTRNQTKIYSTGRHNAIKENKHINEEVNYSFHTIYTSGDAKQKSAHNMEHTTYSD